MTSARANPIGEESVSRRGGAPQRVDIELRRQLEVSQNNLVRAPNVGLDAPPCGVLEWELRAVGAGEEQRFVLEEARAFLEKVSGCSFLKRSKSYWMESEILASHGIIYFAVCRQGLILMLRLPRSFSLARRH